MANEEAAKKLRTALGKVPGIQFNAAAIQPGKEPRYFSDPVVIEIADSAKTTLGALAQAAVAADTPHRDQHPPGLHLHLIGLDQVNEMAVKKEEMAEVACRFFARWL